MSKISLEILQKNLDFLNEGGLSLARAENMSLAEILQLAERHQISPHNLWHSDLQKLSENPFADIELLVMDCDGVLTDGGMYFTESGDEIKRFNAKDGLGIKLLQKSGRRTAIISAGINQKIVMHRAQMLGIERVYVGSAAKLDVLQGWLREWNLSPAQVAYIGDDLTDLPCMREVGISICPADAALAVIEEADLVLATAGGQGCIRELTDRYFQLGKI